MNFKTTLVIFYICILSFQASAQESNNINELVQSQVRLYVTPSVCIVRERGQLCEMRATVYWISPTDIDACLYSNDTLLMCWNNKKEIREKLTISLQDNISFILKNKRQVLAKQQIKVNASQSNKFRRRLRSQWSLF